MLSQICNLMVLKFSKTNLKRKLMMQFKIWNLPKSHALWLLVTILLQDPTLLTSAKLLIYKRKWSFAISKMINSYPKISITRKPKLICKKDGSTKKNKESTTWTIKFQTLIHNKELSQSPILKFNLKLSPKENNLKKDWLKLTKKNNRPIMSSWKKLYIEQKLKIIKFVWREVHLISFLDKI